VNQEESEQNEVDGMTKGLRLCSVLRPRQHSIGYMGDGFYRSKDPTNSIKVLMEMLQGKSKERKQLNHTYRHTIIDHTKRIYTK